MRFLLLPLAGALMAATMACGGGSDALPARDSAPPAPAVDPATAATVTVAVSFEGAAPAPAMLRLDGDPKCVAENGARDRPAESIVLGDHQALESVFVYVKSGLENYTFPVPTEPVVLDQRKCRYLPRVFGIRVGQPLEIRNSDPLIHNVHAYGEINQPFNMGQPVQGTSFTRTFTTSEVMLPFRCDVHAWMQAWAGVVPHPFFGVTGQAGTVTLAGLPPGTFTIEAWHEELGTKAEEITIGARESKDVHFTFAR